MFREAKKSLILPWIIFDTLNLLMFLFSLDFTNTIYHICRLSIGLNPEQQYSTDCEITVRLGRAPHATHLNFKPLTADFLDIDTSVDSFLTRVLPKQFVTLSPGQIIKLRHAGQDYSLLVTEVKPKADAVLIIDTNVAVTFDPPSDDSTGTRRRMQQIKLDEEIVDTAPPSGNNEFLQYWITIPSTIDLSTDDVVITAKNEPLTVTNTGNKLGSSSNVTSINSSSSSTVFTDDDNNVEVFVGMKRRPRLVEHLWAITTPGGGSVALIDDTVTFPEDLERLAIPLPVNNNSTITTTSTPTTSAGTDITEDNTTAHVHNSIVPRTSRLYPMTGSYRTFYISVHSDGKQEIRFRLQVSVVPRTIVTASSAGAVSVNPGGDTKQCSNCQAWVPSNAYAMHTAVCARNNIRCNHPGCGTVLRKGSKEANEHAHCDSCSEVMVPTYIKKHKALWHTDLVCEEGCGAILPLRLMHMHANDECARRMITCRFCNDRVRSGGRPTDAYDRSKNLTVHEAACGSRTRTCTYCKPRRGVLYKQYDDHMKIAHPDVLVTTDTMSTNSSSSSSNVPNDSSNSNTNMETTSTTPTVQGIGGVSYNSTKEWQCDRCTFVNMLSNASCELCNNNRPTNTEVNTKYNDESEQLGRTNSLQQEPVSPLGAVNNSLGNNTTDSRMNIESTYINLPPLSQSCANKTCSGRAPITHDVSSARSRWKLCNRCYNEIVVSALQTQPLHLSDEDDFERSKEIVVDALLIRYMAQLSEGCNFPYCRNPYCVKGDSNANRNNRNMSLNTELAFLINDVNDGIYHVCVGNNSRLTVRPINKKSSTPSSTSNSQRTSPAADMVTTSVITNSVYGPSTTSEGLSIPSSLPPRTSHNNIVEVPTYTTTTTTTTTSTSSSSSTGSSTTTNNRSRTSSVTDNSRKLGTAKGRVASEFFG